MDARDVKQHPGDPLRGQIRENARPHDDATIVLGGRHAENVPGSLAISLHSFTAVRPHPTPDVNRNTLTETLTQPPTLHIRWYALLVKF